MDNKIKKLGEKIDKCFDDYVDIFCEKQETYSLGWTANIKGSCVCIADAYLSFEDIRLDLEYDMEKGVIWDWYWDNIDLGENALSYYAFIKNTVK